MSDRRSDKGLPKEGKEFIQLTMKLASVPLKSIRLVLHKTSNAIDAAVYKVNPNFIGVNSPIGRLNLEFFKAALVGYGLGVIGTRRVLIRPLICATIFGSLWQISGLRI